MTVTAKALTPFGAQIDGDLRDPRNDSEVADLLREYGLLVFRDQDISFKQQARMMSASGPVLDDWTGTGYVSNTRADGILASIELAFHSDLAYTPMPFIALSLHAIDVPRDATSTRFASAANAYEQLPDALRAELDGRELLNLFPLDDTAYGSGQQIDDYPENGPRATHPLFVTDSLTGRRAVMASQMMTAEIVGMERPEREKIIKQLYTTLYAPKNIYEHFWRNGDVVIWSNIAIQHARSSLVTDQPRTLQRVCIAEGPPEMYTPTDFLEDTLTPKEAVSRMAPLRELAKGP